MLPVERVVADGERSAKLAPLYSLASLYKYAEACPAPPVRLRPILSKQDRSSTSLTIFSLNWADFSQPVNELYQTADHPALSPIFAILNGGSKRRTILADLASPRCKPAENTRQKNVRQTVRNVREEVWFGSFLQRLMVS